MPASPAIQSPSQTVRWLRRTVSLALGLPLVVLILAPLPVVAAKPQTQTTQPLPGVASPGNLAPPSQAELEARIKDAESASGLDDAAKAALIERFRRAMANLESVRTFQAKAAEYAQALEGAPAETASIRAALAEDKTQGPPPAPNLDKLSADELSQRLGKVQTEAAIQETRASELDKLIELGSARPAQARARVAELKSALDQVDAETQQAPPQGQSADLSQAIRWDRASRRAAVVAEMRAIEQELASQGVRDELYRARRDQTSRRLAELKSERQALEAAQAERRKADAEEAQREADAAEREATDKHPLVQRLARENAETTASLAQIADSQDALSNVLAQVQHELKRVEDDFKGSQQRLKAAGLSKALGQILVDRRNQLPDLRAYRKAMVHREDQIAEATLAQIRNREEEQKLSDMDQALADLVAEDPSAQTPAVRAELRDLLEQRNTLLDKDLAAEESEIRKMVEVNEASAQLIRAVESYDKFLAEHLLWVRLVAPVSLRTLTDLPAGIAWLVSRQGWSEVLHVLSYQLAQPSLAWVGWLVVAVLIWKRSAIARAIRAAALPLRRVRTDAFRYTLRAMGLTLLAALPIPLAFIILGRNLALSIESTPFTRAIGESLIDVSLGLYFLRAFYHLCIAEGVADRHFRWSSGAISVIRGNLRWFTLYIIPFALVASAFYHLSDQSHNASIGRLALLALMIGVSVFFARLLNPHSGALNGYLKAYPDAWLSRLHNLWYPGVVGAPLALCILTLMGYQYTAGALFQSLVQSAWLALGMVVLQQAIVRWLMLTRRRLALQAALERQAARRAQAEAQAESPKDSAALSAVEEPELDLASLDEQTRRLVNALVVFASLACLWLIWSGMLPAFNMLEQFTLWHYPGTVDGTVQQIPVSVADVAVVLVILTVATVATRNLPALLEILMLQGTDISAGTRYAVRTLLSYAIAAVAFLSAFATLGLTWGSVQWLVAALGVGIGFGLQEIVANFVSGLIILFERPVRVGDVVTVGDTTGVVTRIQIRATTIRNWDKQELLVPNKELITGRLLNWTLSDQVTRILINVGVEYGSDTDLAMALLAEIAAANRRVLKDPPPFVTFEGFGDNALLLVLRCYLDSLDYRLAVMTELHRAIDKRFAEQGIGIAFPQRDIHLSAREPIEVRLRRGTGPATDGGPGPTGEPT